MIVLLLIVIVVVLIFCFNNTVQENLAHCPDHCNCAVYSINGDWKGCQRARMTRDCRPHHKDRVCRNAYHSTPALQNASQFKVGCCGSSCDHPNNDVGHALHCKIKNGEWKGVLHSCGYAGEDLRCHK